MPAPRRRLWAHLGLVVLGFGLGLVVLEGVLQIASLVAGRWNAFEPTATSVHRRMLALGDSNTYGLYVGPRRAYPHRLEADWNARPGHAPLDVVNAGYPGNSSSTVRGQLGELLAAYRPEIVTIMIGGNDWWREPETLEDASVDACVRRAAMPAAPAAPPWHRRWRIVRLVRLLEQWLPVPIAHLVDDRLPSNHAWGTAFDVNYGWNKLGAIPAPVGARGSVRELVPLANQYGFYWGGHFRRCDGMHFEVARVLG
jgi:hypothetical protein